MGSKEAATDVVRPEVPERLKMKNAAADDLIGTQKKKSKKT